MRLLALAAFGLVLATAPVMAQGNSAPAPHVFGTATCPNTIPCSDGSGSLSSKDMASLANSCVTQSFGFHNADGFFDESSGLDSNNCLSPKSSAGAAKLTPQCCVVKQADESCRLVCNVATGVR